MATIAIYNGIQFNSVLVKRFEQTPEYDASKTDVLFSRYTIAFEGLVHAQGVKGIAPVWVGIEGGGAFPPVNQAAAIIEASLWAPRQEFSINMGGQMMLVARPAILGGSNVDMDNGPKPKRVHLTHFVSNKTIGPTFHIEFEIECALAVNNTYVTPFLDNRWSIEETLDDEYFTVRTIRGELRASRADLNPDSYRNLLYPTLEPGFRRVAFDWNLHADSLGIDYAITDKEVHTAAPWPAVKLDVRHSEGTANGASFESECHVALKGHPGASKIDLFNLATRIIQNRLGQFKNYMATGAAVPVAVNLVDSIGERNAIEMYMKIQHAVPPGKNGQLNFLGIPVGQLGVPLGITPLGTPYPTVYNPQISLAPGPWGYISQGGEALRGSAIGMLAFYCFLQVPTDNNHWISQVGITPRPPDSITPQQYYGNTGGKYSTTSGSPGNDQSGTQITQYSSIPPWSQSQGKSLLADTLKNGLYTTAAAETTLTVNPLQLQLPIAQSPSDYKAGADTSVFVCLGLPQAVITFHFECERAGSWPNVPQPVPTFNANGLSGRLLGCSLVPMPPTLDATATQKIYHVSAKITYGLNRPPQPGETIPIGVLPFTNLSPKDTALTLSQLYGGANANLFGTQSPSQSLTGYN